jgi:hypothetical protein
MVKKIQIIVELEPYEPDPVYYDHDLDIDEMAKADIVGDAIDIIVDKILEGKCKVSYRILEE